MLGTVPAYWLYGERLSDRFPDALHIEPIVARSSLHGWTIQPHLHHDLFQFFLVTGGGGKTRVDGRDHRLVPGSVLLLPPATIHEFAFLDGTNGFVASAAAASLRRLFDSEPARSAARRTGCAADEAVKHRSRRGWRRRAACNARYSQKPAGGEFSLGAPMPTSSPHGFAGDARRAGRGAEPWTARGPCPPFHRAGRGCTSSVGESAERACACASPRCAHRQRKLSGQGCSAARPHVIQDLADDRGAARPRLYGDVVISQILVPARLLRIRPISRRFFAKRAGVSPSDYRAKACEVGQPAASIFIRITAAASAKAVSRGRHRRA